MPYLRPFWHFIVKKHLHQKMVYLTIAKFFAIVLQYNSKLRALALENANATLFYHSKNSLYHYTILFYNTSKSQNSISIKILFFNISLLFLSNHHFFFPANDLIPIVTFWNKIYIYIYIYIFFKHSATVQF